MKNNFRNWTSLAVSVVVLVTTACSPSTQVAAEAAAINSDHITPMALVPRPSDPSTQLAQLQRHRGQTQFLNPISENYCGGHGICYPEQEQQEATDEARAEQEADVFKIGKPGSKLLYLLNNYRGLQVVSFADGAERPKILGRVKATGNYPSDMYYDQKQERLLVIEKYSYARDGEDYDQSRLITYSVKDPTRPVVSETMNLKGFVTDSRIVGDVLYVATSRNSKGTITSYNLKNTILKEVQSYQLPLELSYGNSLNIQTVQNEGKLSYYLIATLSESAWGWWDRTNVVQVVDITDAKGKIKLVMSAAAKGFLRERTQTLIKNNTLIVTSNYLVANSDSIARIAVETFRFPTAQSEVLTEKEALYRKMHIDRELQGKSGSVYDALYEKLINDPRVGIKGRFVQAGNDKRKMIPDSGVTVGDGSGLSANLQDVRYADGYLYAFWVPANEIDPFDIFDIRNPEEGVKYVSRLHFEGWIERAIPIQFQNRQFVVGLGRIVPPVNNEDQRRRPQAMIFEILERSGRLQAVQLAQYTFEGSDIWTNYNDDDKTIEVKNRGDGTGEILFPASKYSETSYADGAQILNFDLNKAISNTTESLKPGPFLSGGAEWVRRVFTNTEIGRINSFSDKALAIFGAISGTDTLTPVHVLELARNLQGYQMLSRSGMTAGVQIISDYSWSNENKTYLRVVSAQAADAEKPAVFSEQVQDGSYVAHLQEKSSGDLIVLSRDYNSSDSDNNYQLEITASRYQLVQGNKLNKVGEVKWGNELRFNSKKWRSMRMRSYDESEESLVQLADGTVVAQSDSMVKILDVRSGLAANTLEFANCTVDGRSSVQLQVLSGRPYLSSKEFMDHSQYDLQVTRNWIAPLNMVGYRATCGQQLNIPGKALLVTSTGEILTEDTSVIDIVREEYNEGYPDDGEDDDIEERSDDQYYHRFITSDSLTALKVKVGLATLTDSSPAINQDYGSRVHQTAENQFVRFNNSDHKSQLEFFSLDSEGMIANETYAFKSTVKDGSLSFATPHPLKSGGWLGVLDDGKKIQVIEWSVASPRPQVVKISPLNEKLEKLPAVDSVSVNRGWWYYGDSNRVHFSATQMSFEFPFGLTGLEQIFIAD